MASEYNKHYIIGLTGGIGSGKTTVTNLFSELNVDIIDADIISRQLLDKDSPALKTVIEHFGDAYLDKDRELKRSLLAKTVFTDEQEKHWLENLLHPIIRNEISNLIRKSSSSYLIISAPLLLESKQYDFVDRVLVIDLPTELQISRTMNRDKSSAESVNKILLAQMNRKQRLSYADDIILNTSDLAQLKLQVEKLHDYYRQQSHLKHQAG